MKPKLTNRTITAIQKVISGDAPENGVALAPYRSGPKIIGFFNEHGFNDSYTYGGSPSRWAIAEDRLSEINETERIVAVIEAAVNPAHFLETEFPVESAVSYLNKYLEFDGFVLALAGKRYRLRVLGEPKIDVEAPLTPDQHVGHEFIREQIEKCDRKLSEDDYDGAITSARSLVEAVLSDIESRLDAQAPAYDGDLTKLYRRVQKLLNVDHTRPDLPDNVLQMLRGLVSLINGLASLRNTMSDAHVRTYKPARHHAKLAINTAKTLVDFIYDSFEYQKSKGIITEVVEEARQS